MVLTQSTRCHRLQLLLDARTDVNVGVMTALQYAVVKKRVHCICPFILAGANPDIIRKDDFRPVTIWDRCVTFDGVKKELDEPGSLVLSSQAGPLETDGFVSVTATMMDANAVCVGRMNAT